VLPVLEYGIQKDGVLYFRDRITDVDTRVFYDGKHFNSVDIKARSDRVVNRLYLRGKNILGGGQLTLTRDDTTSNTRIALLGIRSAVVDIPHIRTQDDIWRYGEYYLAEHGERNISDVEIGPVIDYVWPSGRVELREADGTQIGVYDIDSVRYEYDDEGFRGYISVGDEPAPTFGTEMESLIRHIETERSAQVSNTKITHTRGVEFEQSALSDARKNSKFNVWTTSFNDLKSVDENTSFHMFHDQTRQYVGCGYDFEYAEYVFDVISNTGQIPSACRVHYDLDKYGRINFAVDDDLTDFFADDGSSWFIDTTAPKCYQDQFAGGGPSSLWYKSNQKWFWRKATPATAPSQYTFRLFKTDVLLEPLAIYYALVWDWLDVNNYNYIRMKSGTGFPEYNRHWMFKVVGGVHTQVGAELRSLKSSDNEIEIRARAPGVSTVCEVFTNGISDGTISGVMPFTAGNKCGLQAWGIGFPHVPAWFAKMDWWEWRELGSSPLAELWVSRDGGTTWNTIAATQGINHIAHTFTGATGTHLKLKVRLYHPARLYGLGVSF
jgi:hypothetical protein